MQGFALEKPGAMELNDFGFWTCDLQSLRAPFSSPPYGKPLRVYIPSLPSPYSRRNTWGSSSPGSLESTAC